MSQLVVFDRPPYPRRDSCVTCSRTEREHYKGPQPSYCQSFKTLDLPPGKTCGDCIHIRRCNALFGHMEPDQACDWYPIRFHEREIHAY